ncbi:MAG: ComF family protein [Phycisphaerae bacterium]|nr:ComF family protein [Phycisphaerae bacterium]
MIRRIRVPFTWFGRLANAGADLLYPPQCLFCGTGPAPGSPLSTFYAVHICRTCRAAIDAAVAESACPTCGGEADKIEVKNGRCPQCRARGTRLAGTVRLGAYGSFLGPHLRALKYLGREELAVPLARRLGDSLRCAAWFERVEAIAAVPSHWMRRIARPVRTVDLIARELADAVDLPLLPLLRRVRGGPHQIGLSYTQRLHNVRGAFGLGRGVQLEGARILIVDDVMTTGATIEECARVLLRGGAAEVFAAVLVRVDFEPGTVQYLDGV